MLRSPTITATDGSLEMAVEACWLIAHIRDRGQVVTAGVREALGRALNHQLAAGDVVNGLSLGIGMPKDTGMLVWSGRSFSRCARRAWDTVGGQQIGVQEATRFEGVWRPATVDELEAVRWYDLGRVQIVWQRKTLLSLQRGPS